MILSSGDLMFKFIIRVENNGLNKMFPNDFPVPLKKSNTIGDFDINEIKKIIREKYIEKNNELNGKIFYIQKISSEGLGEIHEIGRIWL